MTRRCYECEVFYGEGSDKKGSCQWMDDSALYIPVERGLKCLFKRSREGVLNQEEIVERDEKNKQEKERFLNFLEESSQRIKSWPEWKRESARKALESLT